ncbi:TPA: hypothetical protein N0F65_007508, partial [Lagenidium giganteum]
QWGTAWTAAACVHTAIARAITRRAGSDKGFFFSEWRRPSTSALCIQVRHSSSTIGIIAFMGITSHDTLVDHHGHVVRSDVQSVTRPSRRRKKSALARQSTEEEMPGSERQDSPVSSAVGTTSDKQLTKREMNRVKVRRFYYRRINTIQSLRSEVSSLEKRLLGLLQGMADEENPQPSERADKVTHIQYPSTVRERMLHISKLKVSLYEENELLRHCVREHMKDHGRLQQVIDKELDGVVEVDFGGADDQGAADDLGVVLRLPMTRDESMEIGRTSYREIHQFMQQQVYFPDENNVLGWVLRRHTEDGLHKYLLRKTFHYRSPLEMMEAMWNMLISPSKNARLFSKSLNVRLAIMQHIDQDNLIYFRTMARDGAAAEFRTLFLQTRFETSNGFMIVGRGLKRDRVDELSMPRDRRVEWWDMFSWFSMECTGNYGEHCVFTFGGARPESFGFGIEALLLMLKWESQVLHPQTLLP